MLANFARRLNDLSNQPIKIFWICLCLAIASVLFDASFIHLWSLQREESDLARRIDESKVKLKQLEFQIQESQQPQFIERQARDQFDLVKEGDMVFVFSDETNSEMDPQ